MQEIAEILQALAVAPAQPAALATLVQIEGSSYRRPGARLLLLADGTRLGSISGGCLEDDIVLRAQRVLDSGRAERVTYDTTEENDLVWGVGLGCQGVVRILIEPLPVIRPAWVAVLAANLSARQNTALVVAHGGDHPAGTSLAKEDLISSTADLFFELVAAPRSLVIIGAGDDVQPLVRMAKETGWHVTVADARAAYVTAARFPAADRLVTAPAAEITQRVPLDPDSFVVVMTHRYGDDLALLRGLLNRPLAYLGLLGPRKRTDRLLAALQADGIVATKERLAALHAPVGLDLGGDTPATVALAILAEMHSRLTGRTPVNLRDRPGSIHG